ncbi:ImmA/IrrE family metallo-endopeptidase [Nesterenkonia haasae]|uniref:ImmA/IrrE family metallo-endopeptidase n=1 Tax=Nesterenkonia haasae TaxID=2587813 RepID=UPI0013912BC9|nr:ImmA/IrrE family metallo-endopeptidase [Nesterenkonia haasae]
MSTEQSRPIAVPKSLVIEQVTAMLDHIDMSEPELRSQLFEDAIATFTARDDIDVRLVPDREVDASRCSVAGGYLADQMPPVLAISESASHGRRAFTALHEYGHHLQQSVYDLMERPTQQPDGGLALEDAACDFFASALLLPKDLVQQHIGEKGPSAASVVSLWQAAPQVSRAAVCVRAALALRTPGHVTLLDNQGEVVFSSSRELPPLRRGSDQSRVSIVDAALRAPERTIDGEAEFYYRDGIRGQELYAQAADLGGMTVVVSVSDRAAWRVLSLPRRDSGPKGAFRICEHIACGHEFRTFDPPCAQCGAPTCPECRQCNCAFRVQEKQCPSCFLLRSTQQFDPATGICLECS